MTRAVRFGSVRISYELVRSGRQTMALVVQGDGRVMVRAPELVSTTVIDARVRRRGAWILRQWRRGDSHAPVAHTRRFVSGASVYLLGRELRLGVRRATKPLVRLDRPRLLVFSPNTEEGATAKLVGAWQLGMARKRFEERVALLAPRVLGRGAAVPKVRIASMRRRWGSCSRLGTISLNPLLIEHPAGCIDYVLIHELCHLKHLNHGPAFQSLLARLLPEWRRWKRRLDGNN